MRCTLLVLAAVAAAGCIYDSTRGDGRPGDSPRPGDTFGLDRLLVDRSDRSDLDGDGGLPDRLVVDRPREGYKVDTPPPLVVTWQNSSCATSLIAVGTDCDSEAVQALYPAGSTNFYACSNSLQPKTLWYGCAAANLTLSPATASGPSATVYCPSGKVVGGGCACQNAGGQAAWGLVASYPVIAGQQGWKCTCESSTTQVAVTALCLDGINTTVGAGSCSPGTLLAGGCDCGAGTLRATTPDGLQKGWFCACTGAVPTSYTLCLP
jgi:hypothetical protein